LNFKNSLRHFAHTSSLNFFGVNKREIWPVCSPLTRPGFETN